MANYPSNYAETERQSFVKEREYQDEVRAAKQFNQGAAQANQLLGNVVGGLAKITDTEMALQGVGQIYDATVGQQFRNLTQLMIDRGMDANKAKVLTTATELGVDMALGSKGTSKAVKSAAKGALNIGKKAAFQHLSKTAPVVHAMGPGSSLGWTNAPTVSRKALGSLYPKSLIPFPELSKAMQRKVSTGYQAIQGMADRAVDYSIDKAYELAAIAPWNLKRSGYLYMPPSLKKQLDAIRRVTGEKPHRHHLYSKMADAKARNRIKALGNMQDLRVYDAVMQQLGMPAGGVWTPEMKTLVPINTKYHSGHHKLLQELELEFKGNPGAKMDEVFSKMNNVTDIIQYMVDLRQKTLPYNLRMQAHANQLLDVDL